MLLSRLSSPSLSTIKQDTAAAGRLLISRAIEDPERGHTERLPTDLIIRESCGG
jgi:DNA-binding LacI/PurR family transcriptional regulator